MYNKDVTLLTFFHQIVSRFTSQLVPPNLHPISIIQANEVFQSKLMPMTNLTSPVLDSFRCDNTTSCSDICIEVNDTETCSCNIGYALDEDGYTCVGKVASTIQAHMHMYNVHV